MRKNYFRKALAAAMLLMAGMTFTSCDEVNSVFTSDNGTGESQTEGEVTVTLTSKGASMTVATPSDVTELLDQVKTDIAAKGSAEYVVNISSSSSSSDIESTSSDNTISVPKVVGSNVNLTFSEGVNTDAPLTIKVSETASTTSTAAVDKVTVTMPAGTTGVELNLDMPETTVTLKAAAGTVVYDEVVATTATNTLYIESGVTVKNLQVKGGIVIVKDGGKVETYVYAQDDSEQSLWAGHWTNDNKDYFGVHPKSIKIGEDEVPEVQYENGDPYPFMNLKVVKGKADYAVLYLSQYENKKIEKLTIAEDAAALVDYPSVNTIEGEGKGTAKILFKNFQNYFDIEGEVTDYFMNLYNVNALKNVTIDILEVEGFTTTGSGVSDVPADIENVTFKVGSVYFKDPESASAVVKNCKFEAPTLKREKYVAINVPYQSESISSFKFTFEGCEFTKDCKFNTWVQSSKPKKDANGNQVYETIYIYWAHFGGDSWYSFSERSLEAVPESNRAVGDTKSPWVEDPKTHEQVRSQGYWTDEVWAYEDVEYNDYYVYVVFNSCQYGGSALTPEDVTGGNTYVPSGAFIRYEIGGSLYEMVHDKELDTYVLIPTSK